VHCSLCTSDYGLCYLRWKEAWDAYLESVQYGLDYVLGRCKCLWYLTVCLYCKEKSFITVSGQLMEAAFADELYKASKMDSTEL